MEATEVNLDSLRAYPIASFFGQTGGRRVIHVRCPFHKERTASLALYNDNSFHCYGCQAHGRGAIDFLMKLGADFRSACEELTKMV